MCGSPSDCLNSSFISCSDIFCRSNHCRYWKKIIGDRDHREHGDHRAHQMHGQAGGRAQERRRIEAAPSTSSRWRSGHSTAVITAPSAIELEQALDEIRHRLLAEDPLEPAPRRYLAEFRLERFRRPHQAVLDHVAGDRRQHQHQERHADRREHRISRASAPAPAGPRRRCGSSRNWRPDCAAAPGCRCRSSPRNDDSTSVAPAIMNQVLTSWLLATSPFSCASSRRFCVGSSVLSSLSSAIAASLTSAA